MSHSFMAFGLAFVAAITISASAQQVSAVDAKQAFAQFGASSLEVAEKYNQRDTMSAPVPSQRWPSFHVRTNGQYFGNKERLNLEIAPSEPIEGGVYHISARMMFPGPNRYPDGSRVEFHDAEGAMFGYFYRGFSINDRITVFSREFSNADPDGVYLIELIVWLVSPSGMHSISQQNFISIKLNGDGPENRWEGAIQEVRLVGNQLEIAGNFASGTALVRLEVPNGGSVVQTAPMELVPGGNIVRVPANFHNRRVRAYVTVGVLGNPYLSTVTVVLPPAPQTTVAVPVVAPPR